MVFKIKNKAYSVSFSDLIRHPNYPKYVEVTNEHVNHVKEAPSGLGLIARPLPPTKELESLLEDFGLNTRKEYNYEVVAHKNFSDELVISGRWYGIERHDAKWEETKLKLKK